MRSIDILESWLKNQGYTSKVISLGSPKKSDFLLIKDKSGNELMFSAKRISFPQTTSATRDITSNKTQTYDLAAHFGVNHPKTIVVRSTSYDILKIEKFLNEFKTVVVKPYNGLQSRGLTLDVKHIDKLEDAIKKAGEISKSVIIQQQFEGQEIRFAVIDKKVRSALLRQKPQLIGDGHLSIAELLKNENQSRRSIRTSVVEYPMLEGDLLPDSIDLNAIPGDGEIVEISKATMIRNGASIFEVIDKVDTSYIEIAEKLCSTLIGSLICVDLMIKNYSVPADKTNYSLIEMNLGMSLPLCYSCRDGKHFTIVEDYLGPKVVDEFKLLK